METIFSHRSIRNYKQGPVDQAVLDKILLAGTRASTTGNMQLYSIVVTQDKYIKDALSPCHFNQPMVKQAPVIMTVCADVHRFSLWCEQRGAKPEYHNFAWFINATIDALLAAQNITLEAEANGLGICYLGTTIYTAKQIIDILKLPRGVVPVTTIVMGYPADSPTLTDRLPLDAVVHYDQYKDYTREAIDAIWKVREESEETRNLKEINGLPTLAHIFTERRYKAEDNIAISKKYFQELIDQGFI